MRSRLKLPIGVSVFRPYEWSGHAGHARSYKAMRWTSINSLIGDEVSACKENVEEEEEEEEEEKNEEEEEEEEEKEDEEEDEKEEEDDEEDEEEKGANEEE